MVADGPPNQEEVAYGIAYATIIALLVALISTACANRRSKAWKNTFCSLILLSTVIVEFIYVAQVATKLTNKLANEVIRSDCRNSQKGGKVPGSFRDCTLGEGGLCSKESPCTPCDYPVAPFDFDGRLWNSMCTQCNKLDSVKCREPESSYCLRRRSGTTYTDKEAGIVEVCKSCCFNKGEDVIEVDFEANECAFVYDLPQVHDLLGNFTCNHPSYPVKTRYGCCPKEAARGNNETFLYGNGLRVSECLFRGPFGASWEFCKNEPGCPLYSNGVNLNQDYCIVPGNS